MTWRAWAAIWTFAIVFTAIVVGLAFAVGAWMLVIVFPIMFLGGGWVVTRP